MSFLVIGDLHGRIHELARIDQWAKARDISLIIQVGDLGVRWPHEECAITHYFHRRQQKHNGGPKWIFCLGNHDNYNKFNKLLAKEAFRLGVPEAEVTLIPYAPGLYAANRPAYIPDNGGMLFCGGAVSTDADPSPATGWGHKSPGRVTGLNWWPTEAPSPEELKRFQLLLDKAPTYVFTHDGPLFCPTVPKAEGKCLKSGLKYQYTSKAFAEIARTATYLPAKWFYGHHHRLSRYPEGATQYLCSGLHGQGWSVVEETAYEFNIYRGKKNAY